MDFHKINSRKFQMEGPFHLSESQHYDQYACGFASNEFSDAVKGVGCNHRQAPVPFTLNGPYSDYDLTAKNNMGRPHIFNWQQPITASMSVPPGFDQCSASSINILSMNQSRVSSDTDASSNKSMPLSHYNSATQTVHDATEEKFYLCENILKGCDELKKMTQLMPNSNILEYTDDVRENVLLSLSHNNCSQLVTGATEQSIITEYAKSFIRISESWLGTHNCFGVTDRCSKLCRLEIGDMSENYIEWMHATRRLLGSILGGLHRMNMMYMTDPSVNEDEADGDIECPWNGLARHDEVQKNNGTSYVQDGRPQIKPHNSPPRKYAGQSCPLLPIPPQAYVSVPPLSSCEYMKPSSYNVPRNELTQSKKKMNVTIAKADIVNQSNTAGAYIVGLPVNSTLKLNIDNIDQGQDEKVYQIAVRKKGNESKSSTEAPKEVLKAMGQKSAGALPSTNWEKKSTSYTLEQSKKASHLTTLMLEIVVFFSKCDIPSVPKNKTKLPINLDSINSKIHNSAYENMDQFIYDCRRFINLLAKYCRNGKDSQEKVLKLKLAFEGFLKQNFSDSYKWDYITGNDGELTANLT